MYNNSIGFLFIACVSKSLIMNTEKYIEVYDRIGHKSFGHGDDQQLREWGNSEERIIEIKVSAVKGRLKWYNEGIELYKEMNEALGGTNVC